MQLTARGASGAVAWSSSDETVATVSLGKVTAVGSGSATIRAVSGTSQASASITVTTAASISVSNANLTFNGVPSAPLPDSQTVNITDAGQDTLTGLVLDSISYGTGATDWLAVSLTQIDAPSTLIVRPKTSALAPGSYTATVSISSPVVSTGPQLIAVRFNLARPASIALGSSGATFSVQQGSPQPSQQTITVTNGGDVPLTGLAVGTIVYSSGASGWLDANVTPSVAPASLVLRPNTTSLTPGDYSATVPVTSTVQGVTSASVTVTYHVTAVPTPPAIVLSQGSLSFSGTAGGTVPVQQTINVTDGGQVALTGVSVVTSYAAGQPTNWLTVTSGGTTAPFTITVQPNTASLTAGTYTATLTVASSVATNSPQTVSVSYTLLRPASIVLGASTATFSAQQSTGVPSQQSIAISNGGDAALTGLGVGTIVYTPNVTPWLVASVSSSSAPASLLLQPSTTSLTVGDYTASVPVTSTVAPTVFVTVTYHVTAAPTPPVIVLSQTTLNFSGTSGSSAPGQQTINLTNGGQQALTGVTVTPSYTNGQPSGWLTITPTGTSAPLSFTVQPNTGALAAGTYNATISVASSVATNSPQTVTVTYTLIRPASIVLGATSSSFTAQQNGAVPAQKSISISDGGDAPLTGLAVGTIVYSPNVTPWLAASVSSTSAPSNLQLQPNTTGLTAGDYTATVPVTSTVSGVASQNVTVTYHVAPVIVVSPSLLTFSATRGDPLPTSQPVSITAAGAGTLTGLTTTTSYGAGGSNWLSVSLSGGTAPATITIQPNTTTTLAAGTYTATVQVSSSTDAAVIAKTISITYSLADPPSISLSKTVVNDSAIVSSKTIEMITVSNGGGGTLSQLQPPTISYPAGTTTGWLSASLGSSTAPTTLSLAVSIPGPLPAGTYTATVTVSSSLSGVAPKTVSVSFTRLATMSGDMWPIIKARGCTGCHNATNMADTVNLVDSITAYTNLVGHYAHTSPPTLKLVTPGDSTSPTASYFYMMLKGLAQTVTNGRQTDNMPPSCLNGTNCFGSDTVKYFGIWIKQGALR
jgi:uncharacterized membrane protein